MRKMSFKKFNICFIVFIFLFTNTYTFAESNIVYAPTTTFNAPSYIGSGDVTTPAESKIIDAEIASATYNQESIDYINVYDIVEKNNNYYCYENGELVKNGWRKISRNSFSRFAPISNFNYNFIWAYFTANGSAVKGSSNSIKKVKIGDCYYSFNEYGQLLTGFFNEIGEVWIENDGEDPFDLINSGGTLYHSSELNGDMTSGWYKLNTNTSRYPEKESIWMYFSPSNFKITRSTNNNYKSLTLDGKTYAFDDNGVMLTGFEAVKYNEEHGGSTKLVFFGEDGAEIKNGFYNLDMSDDSNIEQYEDYEDYDEDITIYLSKNGAVYKNMIKKINSGYYGFDQNGVVLKGLTVWSGKDYVATIDVENTDGRNFIITGNYATKNGGYGSLSSSDTLHYFDKKGKRVASTTKLDFSDAIYTYSATNNGALEGLHSGKYYIHGLMVKPENGIRYGVYITSPTKTNYSMSELVKTNNVVINSSGSIVSSKVQKDEDDNYWLISGKSLINIYTVPIKVSGSTYYFKSTNTNGKEDWIKFGDKDENNMTCVKEVLSNGTKVAGNAISDYQATLSQDSAINFNIY